MRRLRTVLALLIGSIVLSGCEFDVYSLPLPGGADVGEDPITVTVMFRDVLDLVPKSSVKVNDVSVGQVTDIELEGTVAKVTLELRKDVGLPDNSIAEIRQTSLLGEKFVSLKPGEGVSGNPLGDGDEIPIDRTGRNPEVEEVLGALSLLLNGGGVAQLKTISAELNLALEGREDAAKSVLTQIDVFVSQLDDNKGDIIAAIESLNRLAITTRGQIGSIDAALEELPSALNSLDRQRDDLINMLDGLNRLSSVGVRVINESKDVTISAFRQLQPTLTELANSGDSFVEAFNVFLTYPFVDEVVGRDPQVARNLHMGDYTNLSAQLDLDLTKLPVFGLPCETLGNELPDELDDILNTPDLCEDISDQINECLVAAQDQGPLEPPPAVCAGLPGGVIDAVCAELPGPLTLLCAPGPNNGGNGGGNNLPNVPNVPNAPNLPNVPNLPNLPGLPNLGGLLGLNRPGFDQSTTDAAPASGRSTTVGELAEIYDPGLVMLLVPGMVVR